MDASAASAPPATNRPDNTLNYPSDANSRTSKTAEGTENWAQVGRSRQTEPMLLARWLPADAITQSYAVHAAALFRYSQRGMLGARWDEPTQSWLYDVMRVRELFVHRDARVAPPAEQTLGTLGETRLAGGGITRRADVRESRIDVTLLNPKLHEDGAIARASSGRPARGGG